MIRVTTAALLILLVILTMGAIAPAAPPATLTTPTSGSMEPTVSTHSLAVVIGTSPEPGDIALYDTPTQDQPVLHRLVDTTEGGTAFITQGDANPQTDQEVGDPAVEKNNIHGVVPEITGTPLAIPYVGLVFTNPIFTIGAWTVLTLSLLYSTGPGKIVRGAVVSHPTSYYLIGIAAVTIIVLPLVILTTPFIVDVHLITSTTADPTVTTIAEPGSTTDHPTTVTSPLLNVLHMTAHANGDVVITNTESGLWSSEAIVTVTNDPSETPATHDGEITMYTYPPVLPESLLTMLASIHPAVAAYTTTLIITIPIIVLGVVMDSKRIVRASGSMIRTYRRNEKHRFKGND